MDIPRESVASRRRVRRILYGASTLAVIAVVSFGLSRLEPAAPSVDQETVWVDTVKRGSMLRQVRGSGTLVPEDVRWIPATTEGRVERIAILPGSRVQPGSVLLELSNPQLELEGVEAESELRAAEAELKNIHVQLESQLLTQESTAASVKAEHHQAQLQVEADEQLALEGLIAELELRLSRVRVEELEKRARIEQKRLEIAEAAVDSQLAVQRGRVDRLRAAYGLKRNQVEALNLQAGMEGVLQEVPVEVGQRVTPGTFLARIAKPGRLKAEVRIAETQARDIQIGQIASIDTRNGVIPGRVTRIDPSVRNGTVTVDVALEGALPRGARPDLTVDGTIELERLEDVLYVGRPAFGQEESNIGLFRLDQEGVHAQRTTVQLGRSSVSTIEIREGLNVGDRVILSDMSQWDAFDRVRLD